MVASPSPSSEPRVVHGDRTSSVIGQRDHHVHIHSLSVHTHASLPRACACTRIHTCTHTRTHTPRRAHARTQAHPHTQMHTHTRAHTHARARTQAQAHARAHTRARTDACARTHTNRPDSGLPRRNRVTGATCWTVEGTGVLQPRGPHSLAETPGPPSPPPRRTCSAEAPPCQPESRVWAGLGDISSDGKKESQREVSIAAPFKYLNPCLVSRPVVHAEGSRKWIVIKTIVGT